MDRPVPDDPSSLLGTTHSCQGFPTTPAELVAAWEATVLPREAWNHAAHLTVALWYLRNDPRDTAIDRMKTGIRRFNAAQGNPTGYHETLTLAWCAVILEFLAVVDRGQPIAGLVVELLERCGDKNFLYHFYSRERLASDEARRSWVAPDLRDLGPTVRYLFSGSGVPSAASGEFGSTGAAISPSTSAGASSSLGSSSVWRSP